MLRNSTLIALICTLAVVIAACTPPVASSPNGEASPVLPARTEASQATSLTVFAAASLTDAFREVAQAFEAAHPGTQVILNFAGSQRLAIMVEQGATADIFAAADGRSVDRLVAAHLIDPGVPVTFARNKMTVIVPAADRGDVRTLKDLAEPGNRLILAGEQVPAGAYARQVLMNLSAAPAYGPEFEAAVLANLVSNEENVKQVVAKVQLGEADAGIVYRSDVTPRLAGALRQIEIPDQYNVTAAYPLAMMADAPNADLAQQFVRFVLAREGQNILERWGLVGVGE
jgi:molybdate transport system substrate-binding protein